MMASATAVKRWTVIRMTAPDDLIRRQDAINVIQAAMKRTFTPVRRHGFKVSVELLEKLQSAGETEVSIAEHVFLSPAPLHAFWFYESGWFFCDNCGGKSDAVRTTPYCPHCGARMDAMPEIE